MQGLVNVRHRDRIKIKFIGEGDFARELGEMIVTLGLHEMVQFDNKIYPLQEIPRMLDGFNLGLVPVEVNSITNFALPLKLLEYTALGIPVVTVKSTAISYYFGDDDCLFYQPGNAKSLPALLDRLVESPELLHQYRERAVMLREKFLWVHEKNRYIALLQELSAR